MKYRILVLLLTGNRHYRNELLLFRLMTEHFHGTHYAEELPRESVLCMYEMALCLLLTFHHAPVYVLVE